MTTTKVHVVQGCHDCPFLKVHEFGQVSCPHTELPEDVVIDSFDIGPPPEGCPLLYGGRVIVMLFLVKNAPPF